MIYETCKKKTINSLLVNQLLHSTVLNKKTMLLTGDKGFIATNLKPRLEEIGYKVIGMDIKSSPSEDIRSELCVKAFFRKYKPDIVIHLAALTGVRKSLKEPLDYFQTNIGGTYNLLFNALEGGCERFLFVSSSSVYGTHKSPLKEGMNCNEQLSPYAVSKKAGEMVCKMWSKKIPVIVFRPFTVYGGLLENMRKDMVIYKLIEAGKNGTIFEKYGKGNSVRGYTHIEDLCGGIIKLLDYKIEEKYNVFNLGGNERIKLNDLIKIVKKKFPNLKVEETKGHSADVYKSYADISKAERELGWKPKLNFREEIEKLICQ